MAKERSQKIKYLLEAGYSYKKISDMANCGISLVQKVSKIRKQQKIKSDNSNT
jgi:transposase